MLQRSAFQFLYGFVGTLQVDACDISLRQLPDDGLGYVGKRRNQQAVKQAHEYLAPGNCSVSISAWVAGT